MKLLFLLFFLFPLSVLASDCGIKDFSLCQSAENGDSLAQMKIADMYSEGDGVKQDKHIAFEWYQKAANQGNV
ncbi:tetratricopeptide repeat protein, partial [Acinetobacter sp. YH16042]